MDEHRQLPYYRLDAQEVLRQLDSSAQGLPAPEAAVRLARLGPNQLAQVHREALVVTFVRQFKNLLVIILLASAGFSLFLHDVRTAVILAFIASINATVGFLQEHRAETLMQSLQRLTVPRAKVLRNGKLAEVDATTLVPGDVLYLEEGDAVPADVRLTDELELATNDFALTGESNPTRKFVHAISADVPLANRHNLLFMGTTIATGNGHGVVVGTAMHTELGRIANLSQTAKTGASPLQRELNNLSKRLTQGVIILAALLTLVILQSHLGLKAALLFAISISAAMIPNGLAAEVSITLAQTAARMARAKALVKKLSAVETLGATTIIATDKTGTLTKNEMTVERALIGKTEYFVTGTGYEANGTVTNAKNEPLGSTHLATLALFFETGVLASNARIAPPDNEHLDWYCVGDPTEGALITLARKAGLDPDIVNSGWREIKEFQFDSARKRMSSVRRSAGHTTAFTKGAPESVLERCTHWWDGSTMHALSPKDRQFFLHYNEARANEAMRNLAFACASLPAGARPTGMKFDDVEQNLTFLGIVSMVDPLREQVPAAMLAAHQAHIKVSIITGDFPTTAAAIAKKAQLAAPGEDIVVLGGEDLPALADTRILQLVERGGVVFSRVAPEDKLRIVELAKAAGQVVAVTGDGINDAPALKRADIGVAMGRTGTDVAKQAAAIVLLDDSFSTLIDAVEQGRLTYRNITKAARCALTDNASELIAVLLGLAAQAAFHIPIALAAVQILAIDVIAQIFPVTALGWDPAQNDLMHDKPRNLQDHIINKHTVFEFLAFGALAAGLSYLNFILFFVRHHMPLQNFDIHNPLYAQATILTYLTIVLCQFLNLLLVRSGQGAFFSSYLFSNKKLLLAFGISAACILTIIYNPWVQPYFAAHALNAIDWVFAVVCASIYLCIRLLSRQAREKSSKKAVSSGGHMEAVASKA